MQPFNSLHVYLIGDNEDSVRRMGMILGRTWMMAYAMVGLAAGLAGIMASMQVAYFGPACRIGSTFTFTCRMSIGSACTQAWFASSLGRI